MPVAITLPESEMEVVLRSVPRGKMLSFQRDQARWLVVANSGDTELILDYTDGRKSPREVFDKLCRELYPDLAEDWDEMPNLDIGKLCDATEMYSNGMDEDDIKNSVTSGGTGKTRRAGATAKRAGKGRKKARSK